MFKYVQEKVSYYLNAVLCIIWHFWDSNVVPSIEVFPEKRWQVFNVKCYFSITRWRWYMSMKGTVFFYWRNVLTTTHNMECSRRIWSLDHVCAVTTNIRICCLLLMLGIAIVFCLFIIDDGMFATSATENSKRMLHDKIDGDWAL